MDPTIFIAKIAAVVYLSIGLGALLNRNYLKQVAEDFIKSPGATYLGMIFAIIIGAVLLNYHGTWTSDWKVGITILGWGGIIKGTTGLILPNFMMKSLVPRILKFKQLYTIAGIVCILLGLFFGYYGFMA